jgi:hypothetical protein
VTQPGVRLAALWAVRIVGLAVMAYGLGFVAFGLIIASGYLRDAGPANPAGALAGGAFFAAVGWCVYRGAAGAIRRNRPEPRGFDVLPLDKNTP